MKVLLLAIYLNCKAKAGAETPKKRPTLATVSEIYPAAKGIPD